MVSSETDPLRKQSGNAQMQALPQATTVALPFRRSVLYQLNVRVNSDMRQLVPNVSCFTRKREGWHRRPQQKPSIDIYIIRRGQEEGGLFRIDMLLIMPKIQQHAPVRRRSGRKILKGKGIGMCISYSPQTLINQPTAELLAAN